MAELRFINLDSHAAKGKKCNCSWAACIQRQIVSPGYGYFFAAEGRKGQGASAHISQKPEVSGQQHGVLGQAQEDGLHHPGISFSLNFPFWARLKVAGPVLQQQG